MHKYTYPTGAAKYWSTRILSKLAIASIKLCRNICRVINSTQTMFLAASLKRCGRNFKVVANTSTVYNPENISIGSNFSSMGGLYLYGNDGIITIGDNCSLNTNVQIGASGGQITIGNNVLIAPNVVIRAADHIYRDPDRLIREQGHIGADIIIEDDVWICANCVITKGCVIGKGSVIAAGSVVRNSIDPYTVVGGVPAKEIKKRG